MCVCVRRVEALRDMQAVAEHMNEMQKIYDEYGSVFDALSSDGGAPHCRVRPRPCCLIIFSAAQRLIILIAINRAVLAHNTVRRYTERHK